MPELTDTGFRQFLADALSAHSRALCVALADSFGAPIENGHPYLIEIDPYSCDLKCVPTDEGLLPDNTLFDAIDGKLGTIADDYEEAGIDTHEITIDAIPDWLADCWASARGSTSHPRAFAFLHGYNDQYFDLCTREWVSVDVAYPA